MKFKIFWSKLQQMEKGYFIKFFSFSSFINSKLPHKFKKEEYS